MSMCVCKQPITHICTEFLKAKTPLLPAGGEQKEEEFVLRSDFKIASNV